MLNSARAASGAAVPRMRARSAAAAPKLPPDAGDAAASISGLALAFAGAVTRTVSPPPRPLACASPVARPGAAPGSSCVFASDLRPRKAVFASPESILRMRRAATSSSLLRYAARPACRSSARPPRLRSASLFDGPARKKHGALLCWPTPRIRAGVNSRQAPSPTPAALQRRLFGRLTCFPSGSLKHAATKRGIPAPLAARSERCRAPSSTLRPSSAARCLERCCARRRQLAPPSPITTVSAVSVDPRLCRPTTGSGAASAAPLSSLRPGRSRAIAGPSRASSSSPCGAAAAAASSGGGVVSKTPRPPASSRTRTGESSPLAAGLAERGGDLLTPAPRPSSAESRPPFDLLCTRAPLGAVLFCFLPCLFIDQRAWDRAQCALPG